jgi:serine/threonine protein kinase
MENFHGASNISKTINNVELLQTHMNSRTRSNTTVSDSPPICFNENMDTIVDSKYKIIRTICKGPNSKLKLAVDLNTNTDCVLKIQIKSPKYSSVCFDFFNKEIKNHKKLGDNHNIIKLLDSNMQGILIKYKKQNKIKRCCYMALEYANKGDMFNYILTSKGFDLHTARFYFKALINAVESMHNKNIAHRDIKLDNILLDNDFKLLLTDFEFCADIKNDHSEYIQHEDKLGTIAFMAPEFFDYKRNKAEKGKISKLLHTGDAVDIFACGVVLFTMLFGVYPFASAERFDEHYKYFFSEEFSKFWDKFRTENIDNARLDNLNCTVKDLIEKMFCVDPEKRIKISEIRNHSFMIDDNENNENVIAYMNKIWYQVKDLNEQIIL